jgi:hypothetical protein
MSERNISTGTPRLPRADDRPGRTQPERPLEDYPDLPPKVQKSRNTNMAD